MLLSAHVDDSLRLPDTVRPAVPRLRAHGDQQVGGEDRFQGEDLGCQRREQRRRKPLIEGEVTALEAEFDSTGTYTVIRGYDRRTGCFAVGAPRPTRRVTASDVATQVAQRAGLKVGTVESTSTVFDHVSQGGVTDWEFLDGIGQARSATRWPCKDGKFDFRKPPKADTAPDSGGRRRTPIRSCCGSGTDLLRFRSVITSAEQVKEVQARGWDIAQKKAFVANAPAETTSAVLPTIDPVEDRQDVRRPDLRRQRCRLPHPGRGGRRRRGDRRADRRCVRRVRGRRPRQSRNCGPARRSPSTTSARRSTGST